MTRIEADVLVLGAGAAGLITALNVRGRRVTIVTPDDGGSSRASSDLAQGGLAAAVGHDDTPELHLQDTLRAGQHRTYVPAAQFACDAGPSAVTYLESLGIRFARRGEGISLHREAVHSRARVLHADGDATGAAIMNVLRKRVAEAPHIEVLSRARAVSLIPAAARSRGIDVASEVAQTLCIQARDVVVATGGLGGLYSRTTNPTGACGDGVAMALAAGVRCAALEFVQFHPTALDADTRPLPLLTEALRGAGAVLIDDSGQRIMLNAHPLADLAPRDVVARRVYEIQRAGGRIWLDATRIADLPGAFPSAHKACRTHGIDPAREPVPITPAAHYHMGGIAVNLDGRTNLPGLWAVGEAACTGLHGANRLASNSLLEAVVFGRRLGDALTQETHAGSAQLVAIATQGGEPRQAAMDGVGELMWRSLGLVRDAGRIADGLARVATLREATHEPLWRHRLLLIEHMLRAAARRRTSCGAHFRSDDPGVHRRQPYRMKRLAVGG